MTRFACLLFLAGCATITTVDGIRVNAAGWERLEPELRQRAGFDLECEPAVLEVTLLRAESGGGLGKNWPDQAGARRGVYVRTPSGWVANVINGSVQ